MPTTYKINLVNKQAATKKFWCFLNAPQISNQPTVFANSNTFLSLPKTLPGSSASFDIPLQYSVQAGASNKAVGLNTKISSSVTQNTNLGVSWLAAYSQNGNNLPPTLKNDTTPPAPPTNGLVIKTNVYDKSKEPLDNWYGNLTFGVKTSHGFIGLTWSPDPSTAYITMPNVSFYVTTGKYQTNTLANISAIALNAAHLTASDFDGNLECTVTLNADGTWSKNAGKPALVDSVLDSLVESHLMLSTAHLKIADLVHSTVDIAEPQLIASPAIKEASRQSTGVNIKQSQVSDDNGETSDFNLVTGSVTLATALGVGFTTMVAAGIVLNITHRSSNGLTFDFSYNGTEAMDNIIRAFQAGADIIFKG